MMRCLARNKTKIYYALYNTQTEIVDEYGNRTGQFAIEYTNPIEMLANVSAAKGEMQTRQFGETESYDRVIVLDDVHTPINEYAILWVDTLPHINEDGTTDTPHDYLVKNVARSLNSVSVAISKVSVR